MRTLAVSDMHFGAWTGDPVLAREPALSALDAALEDVDELVLLGDVFDFLFSSVEYAFEQADPFFDLVQRRMQGRRVLFTAGNHDHHIVVRALRSAVEEKVATGAYRAERPGFFQRFLERRLEGVETEIFYPAHRVGDVLLTHGHYLDAHIGGSFPNRLQARATRTVGGVNGHHARLNEQDYESVIVPLTELLFTVAQMPRGCAVQMAFHQQFARIGKVLRHVHVRHARAPDLLAAFEEVRRNLGWRADRIVFAHTHQALDGVERGGVRYWNTGCWIEEPGDGTVGTAVLIDTDEPEPRLLRLLERAGTPA